MDIIYNFKQIGDNDILVYYQIPIDDPFFLVVLKVPCFHQSGVSKVAIISATDCGDYFDLSFTGVPAIYEDLLNGEIYFQNIGTWSADVYYQDNDTNVDPVNATYLDSIQFQVNYG